MSVPRVAYTDPEWAVGDDGSVDAAHAWVEADVYGDEIDFDLGVRHDGRFVTAGRDVLEYVEGADALVVYRCQVTRELLEATGGTCRVVARQGVGVDNLNAPLLAEAGVYGFNVPDYCGDEVSTHTVALTLALERCVCVQNALVKSDRWSIHAGGIPRRTAGLTAGLVGYGRIGRATSRKLQPIYKSVLAYDPYVSADLMAGHGVEKRESLQDLLAASDVVIVHAALTPETEAMIGAAALDSVKPGALLVNTARGKLVDARAVLDALEDGRLGGFASDVFSPEDPNRDADTRKLLERDDVVVSAHRAFLSQESEVSLRRRVAEDVARVLREGRAPGAGRLA
jgi:phosphoglycerate dehydrogenase-like enzyme